VADDRSDGRSSDAGGPRRHRVGEILSIFDPTELPGALAQPDYFKYEGTLALNYREPRGNPRRGGRYGLSYQRFEDTAGGRFSFDRFEVDLQQYIPLLRDRRVLALHGFTSISDADGGAEVPFYLQRTLGGPDDLRGFRHLRFRDRNVLLLQAEYRWENLHGHGRRHLLRRRQSGIAR
jgi:outer membrane protein assembly factor BamA